MHLDGPVACATGPFFMFHVYSTSIAGSCATSASIVERVLLRRCRTFGHTVCTGDDAMRQDGSTATRWPLFT